MKPLSILCVLLLIGGASQAATLYRWTDASGIVRYGYQPPPGADAEPAEEERQTLSSQEPACPDLAQHHLRVIDAELARIRDLPTGLGPNYELTPAAQRELMQDLLAHRAAVLTGRPASEFRAPNLAGIERDKSRLQEENTRLRQALQARESTIDAQRQKLEQARRPGLPWLHHH